MQKSPIPEPATEESNISAQLQKQYISSYNKIKAVLYNHKQHATSFSTALRIKAFIVISDSLAKVATWQYVLEKFSHSTFLLFTSKFNTNLTNIQLQATKL